MQLRTKHIGFFLLLAPGMALCQSFSGRESMNWIDSVTNKPKFTTLSVEGSFESGSFTFNDSNYFEDDVTVKFIPNQEVKFQVVNKKGQKIQANAIVSKAAGSQSKEDDSNVTSITVIVNYPSGPLNHDNADVVFEGDVSDGHARLTYWENPGK